LVGLSLTSEKWILVYGKSLTRDKRSSLFYIGIFDEEKEHYALGPVL